MKKYVVGFCFSEDRSKVLLIRKNKPEWQKGRLNGIGGKIEDTDESPLAAMRREAKEEADIIPEWEEFGTYEGPDYKLWLFYAFCDSSLIFYRSMTDEEIVRLDVDSLPWRDESKMIWNLNWMIPLALDKYAEYFRATEFLPKKWYEEAVK